MTWHNLFRWFNDHLDDCYGITSVMLSIVALRATKKSIAANEKANATSEAAAEATRAQSEVMLSETKAVRKLIQRDQHATWLPNLSITRSNDMVAKQYGILINNPTSRTFQVRVQWRHMHGDSNPMVDDFQIGPFDKHQRWLNTPSIQRKILVKITSIGESCPCGTDDEPGWHWVRQYDHSKREWD